jgi:predicted RNase H-like nuclease
MGVPRAWLQGDARSLLAALPAGTVAIDIPIGLPDAGPRACDQAARRRLGPRRSSVFPAPIRPLLETRTHKEACDLSRRLQARGLSRQAFHLIPRIREVDAQLQRDPSLAERLVESHPELAFAHRNGGTPMRHSKREAAGRAERQALLDMHFPGAFARIRPQFRRSEAGDDDILDALVLLLTAGRLARGEAILLGDPGARDGCGLPMRIAM